MAHIEIDDGDFQAWANRVRGRIDKGYLKQELNNLVDEVGTYALRQLKANTPVDSGNLRRGWNLDGVGGGAGGWVIRLSDRVEYASFVEYGHRTRGGGGWVSGQFYTRKGIQDVEARSVFLSIVILSQEATIFLYILLSYIARLSNPLRARSCSLYV